MIVVPLRLGLSRTEGGRDLSLSISYLFIMLIYKEQGQTYQGDQHNDESPPKLEQVFEQSPLVRFSMLHYAGPLYRIWEMLVVFLSDLSVFLSRTKARTQFSSPRPFVALRGPLNIAVSL